MQRIEVRASSGKNPPSEWAFRQVDGGVVPVGKHLWTMMANSIKIWPTLSFDTRHPLENVHHHFSAVSAMRYLSC